jgi:cell pole-organizing protein PopZ
MSSTNTQHEPTMEEILASIRKIISEDQEPAKPVAPPPQLRAVAPAPPPAPEPLAQAPESDVLDLTDEVRDETVPAAPAALPPQPENDVVFEAVEAAKAEPMTTSDLISDSTRKALGRSLAKVEEPDAANSPSGGAIEAIFTRAVQDAFVSTLQQWVDAHHGEILNELKPMIRAWMDENLPPLIEAAVASELGHLNGTRRR